MVVASVSPNSIDKKVELPFRSLPTSHPVTLPSMAVTSIFPSLLLSGNILEEDFKDDIWYSERVRGSWRTYYNHKLYQHYQHPDPLTGKIRVNRSYTRTWRDYRLPTGYLWLNIRQYLCCISLSRINGTTVESHLYNFLLKSVATMKTILTITEVDTTMRCLKNKDGTGTDRISAE